MDLRSGSPGTAAAGWRSFAADSADPLPGDGGELRLDGGGIVALGAPLAPRDLPIGVHTELARDGTPRGFLAIVPAGTRPPRRGWGVSAFLAPLRFSGGEGIGGLAEAERLARWTGARGGEYLMLGPIAAGTVTTPRHFSPYSPLSRSFDDLIYLSVEDLARRHRVAAERLPELGELRELDDRPVVDLDRVLVLKLAALRRIFGEAVGERAIADLRTEFAFADRDSRLFAAFCVASQLHGDDWRAWPKELAACEPSALDAFRSAHAADLDFFSWCQHWLDRQLGAVATQVELIRDLPVGAPPNSAEAWQWQALVADGWVLGSPPDYFNPQGHRWDLVAFDPDRHLEAGLAPLRRALRHTFRHAAGVRIDHAFGLFRQFWMPSDDGEAGGHFVAQPVDPLLDVIAIEAAAADAFVLTEELGSDPPAGLDKLRERGFVEFGTVVTGLPPDDRPVAVATTTHDLPTVAGAWTGVDSAKLEAVGAPIDRDFAALCRDRLREMSGLPDDAAAEDVVCGLVEALAHSGHLLTLLSLEDLTAAEDRINVPGGTTYGFANFRLRTEPLDQALSAKLPTRLIKALSSNRASFDL